MFGLNVFCLSFLFVGKILRLFCSFVWQNILFVLFVCLTKYPVCLVRLAKHFDCFVRMLSLGKDMELVTLSAARIASLLSLTEPGHGQNEVKTN